MKKQSRLRNYIKKTKPKVKRFMNILIGLAIFVILISTAFELSFLFGLFFVLGFALSIYNGT